MDSVHEPVKLVPQLIRSYKKRYEGPLHLHPFRLRVPKLRTRQSRLIARKVGVADMGSAQRLPIVQRRPSSVIND